MAQGDFNDAIETIKRTVQISDLAQDLGFTIVKKGRYYSLKEHGSVMIDTKKNCFYRNSMVNSNGKVVSGNPIQFYKHFTGETDDSRAVRALLQKTNYVYMSPDFKPKPKKELKKPFYLPEKFDGKYKRTFAYLMGRGIDPEIIRFMIDRKYLYEGIIYRKEKKIQNMIFVGYGKSGVPEYYHQKGTNTEKPFAGDPIDCISNKAVGIYISNGSKSLIISEAVVDSLSVMTIQKMNGHDFHAHNHLVMCGNNVNSVRYWLANSPMPEQVILAVDSDSAGDRYRNAVKSILAEHDFHGKLYDRRPITNDFNDELQKRLGIGKFKEPEQEIEISDY